MLRLIAFTLVFLVTCGDQLERDFFSKYPPATRVASLRQYSLDDQYRIFRYGIDKVNPEAWTLADPIAEKGNSVMPFLTGKLNAAPDDVTVHDILIILWRMHSLNTFDVRQDMTVMHFLEVRVPKIKNSSLQYRSRMLLEYIKVGHHSST
jgi:hypothetical protein